MQYAQLVIVMENRKNAEQNEAFSVKLYNLLRSFTDLLKLLSLKTLLVSLNHNNWRSNIEQVFENPPGASFSGPQGVYSFVSLEREINCLPSQNCAQIFQWFPSGHPDPFSCQQENTIILLFFGHLRLTLLALYINVLMIIKKSQWSV